MLRTWMPMPAPISTTDHNEISGTTFCHMLLLASHLGL
jgi:hypothetical protein